MPIVANYGGRSNEPKLLMAFMEGKHPPYVLELERETRFGNPQTDFLGW